MKRLTPVTDSDTLVELRNRLNKKGYESGLLDLRLEFNEHAQIRDQYLSKVFNREKQPKRLYHNLLPTQASGRWSVTNPPLVNFPPDIRDVVWPDEGEAWIVWDLDAIEAKIVAAFSHDRDDLEAFDKGYDIHTITACRMTGIELPPNLKDPHQSPECKDWREKLGWIGKDDKRRVLAKVRYCLLYGKDATAVNGSKYEKDMVKMGFRREELVIAGQQFLRSKPNLLSCKRRWWDLCAKKSEARTIFGRRRRLLGDYWSRAKEGWNHMVQGSVTDMVNLSLIELCQPPYRLIYPSHDAGKVAVPVADLKDREKLMDRFRSAVENQYEIDGEKFISTATWHIYHADGTVEHL